MNISELSNEDLNKKTALEVMRFELKGEYYIHIGKGDLLRSIREDSLFGKRWNPSEDYHDAFELVQAMIGRSFDFDLVYHEFNHKEDGNGWAARFPAGLKQPNSQNYIWAPTPSLAICRAALFANYMN
jgi:hypothetical protein